jgi:hypothetical protein
MPTIQVEQSGTAPDGWDFLVQVREDGSRTEHRVTLAVRDYERLSRRAVTPEALVEKTFEFLLAREPKESILRQFELTVVTHYFPQFETELERTLAGP